ncbi:MAG: substrate-binding domain-containing protein [Rhodospirillales bacterium]|nr:substrate-binding domain-containing protein [Rhodospirillales bacterium]
MPRRTLLTLTATALIALAAWVAPSLAQEKSIIVQSTTSTQNSGLYKHLLPIFEKKTGIKVHVVAVGTGQAIKNAANGDGDVLLVHAESAEEQFVKDGWGVERFDLMYNDYIVVGPPADPAKVGGMKDAKEAFKKIAAAQAPFVSRGDNSGTHKAELQLWKAAGVDPKKASGKWYREAGSGMGAALNTGVGMGAYVLTDRGTWISFKNKGDFKIQVEGAKDLFNQYGIMLVNPKKHPKVKAKEGQAFIDWLLGSEGQKAIADFKLAGRQLFFPNAKSRKSS